LHVLEIRRVSRWRCDGSPSTGCESGSSRCDFPAPGPEQDDRTAGAAGVAKSRGDFVARAAGLALRFTGSVANRFAASASNALVTSRESTARRLRIQLQEKNRMPTIQQSEHEDKSIGRGRAR